MLDALWRIIDRAVAVIVEAVTPLLFGINGAVATGQSPIFAISQALATKAQGLLWAALLDAFVRKLGLLRRRIVGEAVAIVVKAVAGLGLAGDPKADDHSTGGAVAKILAAADVGSHLADADVDAARIGRGVALSRQLQGVALVDVAVAVVVPQVAQLLGEGVHRIVLVVAIHRRLEAIAVLVGSADRVITVAILIDAIFTALRRARIPGRIFVVAVLARCETVAIEIVGSALDILAVAILVNPVTASLRRLGMDGGIVIVAILAVRLARHAISVEIAHHADITVETIVVDAVARNLSGPRENAGVAVIAIPPRIVGIIGKPAIAVLIDAVTVDAIAILIDAIARQIDLARTAIGIVVITIHARNDAVSIGVPVGATGHVARPAIVVEAVVADRVVRRILN